MSLIKGSCHMLIRPSFVNNLVTTEATNQPYDEDTQMFNIHNSPAYRAQEIGLKQVVGEDGTVHNIEARLSCDLACLVGTLSRTK